MTKKTSLKATSLKPWLWYPLVMVSAVSLHLILATNFSLLVSTYIPVTLAALSILLLEQLFPYRDLWKPNARDLFNDGIVQIILPQLLTLLTVLTLATIINLGTSIWPKELPDIAQVLLMILIANFLRYWLHVICHNWFPLWQLHSHREQLK